LYRYTTECIRARTLAAKPAAPGGAPNARPHVPYRRSKLTLLMKDVFDIEVGLYKLNPVYP
jgi:hypothetical protein